MSFVPARPSRIRRLIPDFEELEKLAKETEQAAGYKRVVTPHIAKESMYITSGHLPYYQDSGVSEWLSGPAYCNPNRRPCAKSTWLN